MKNILFEGTNRAAEIAVKNMKEIKKILEYINAELIKANTDTTGEDGLKAIAINIAGMKENLYDFEITAPVEMIEMGYFAGFGGQNSAAGMGMVRRLRLTEID